MHESAHLTIMKRSRLERPIAERSAASATEKRPRRSAGLSLSELAKKNVTEKRTVSESLGSAARNLIEIVTRVEQTSTLLDASRNWDTHHLFTLHRLVLRRNAYTELCLKVGKKLLLPSAHSSDD